MIGKFSVSGMNPRSLATAAVLLCTPAAWAGSPAGGSIDYGPLAASVSAVPTLGEWMLVLMGLLLAVVAYRGLRGRVNGRLMSNLTLAAGVLAATVAGHSPIQEVKADMSVDEQDMSSPNGGTVTGTYWTRLTNTSGVPLKIKAIQPNGWSRVVSPPPESPECTVNSTVLPGQKCNIRFDYLPE